MPCIPLSTSSVSVVAAADDAVADGELQIVVGAFLAKRAEVASQLARRPVERVARIVLAGYHHRLPRSDRGRGVGPLLYRLGERLGRLAECLDAPGAIGPFQVAVWAALVQRGERAALGRVALADDLRQADDTDCAADGGEPAAGLHRGELSRIANRDDLRGRLLGDLQQPRTVPCRGHARLVEDENASLGQLIAQHLHVDQQSVQSTRRDAGLLAQLAGTPTGGRHAEHRIASALVDLSQDASGVGLAGARERLDHAHAVAVAEDRAHGVGLLGVQRAVGGDERPVDE